MTQRVLWHFSYKNETPICYWTELNWICLVKWCAWFVYTSRYYLMESIIFASMRVFHTVYPKKYAHGFVVLCFIVVMQSFTMNSHEVFIHIHQGCFAGTGAIVRLPQCQWSKPDGYGKISQCITTTKHSKAKTVCIFLGIYCSRNWKNQSVTINPWSIPSLWLSPGLLNWYELVHLSHCISFEERSSEIL